MLVDELVDTRSDALSPRARSGLDWVAPVEAIDAGAGSTHRSVIAHALIVLLFADLVDRVPSARSYGRAQATRGRRIVLDHGAVRTVAWPSAAALPAGVEQVGRVLRPLGWEHRDTYPLTAISMTGTSWSHADAPESIAQWFVSEFHPDEFPLDFRTAVSSVLAAATEPLDPNALWLLDRLATDHALPDADAVALLPVLLDCFRRRHPMPTLRDHRLLAEHSPEMAWIATEGTTWNHATDRVDDIVAAAEEERISGRPVTEQIERSSSGRVLQTAHRAAKVERRFAADDTTGGTEIVTTVPGSFFELIQRSRLPDGRLDLAFDAANAQGIFAMTRTAAATDGRVTGRPVTDRSVHDRSVAVGASDERAEGEEGRHGVARQVTRPSFTFKLRRRHLSPKRQAEFETWIARWGVSVDGPALDWDDLFGRAAGSHRRGLDIGFGHGESTILMARAEPDLDVIGVEVHDPGLVTVLDAIENEPLRNVRVMHGDVIRFLRRIETDTLDVVRVFFPDPWKKVRQHHRRLVRDDVVAALTDRLRTGGVLHLATDIADYAEQMQATCDAEPRLAGGVIERPDTRPLTRFEQRGLDEGRDPVDLWYERV
ncbi:MAG: tRNA (guanosine(46)-N7)-methyltransferase TrmB [Actinomycetota bacterium]